MDGLEEAGGEQPLEPTLEAQQDGSSTPDWSGKDNPAWAPMLEILPTQLHEIVKPRLAEWDRGVNSRFQEIHQQYAPYKEFEKSGYDPETIQTALGMLEQLNEDPRRVWDAMAEYYQFQAAAEAQQQSEQQPQSGSYEPEIDPEIARLQEMVESMAQILVSQNQSEVEASEDAALDQELSTLSQKYGQFDELYVLTLMQNGMDAESAVRQFQQLTDSIATNAGRASANAPTVLGSGGGLPTGQVDVTKLDSKGTKSLVAQLLQQANQNNQ